jgi:TonB family protein
MLRCLLNAGTAKRLIDRGILAAVAALLFGGAIYCAQAKTAKVIDPQVIEKAYKNDPADTDLRYTGRVLVVNGTVTDIQDDLDQGNEGRALFASPSEIQQNSGGGAITGGATANSGVNQWSCFFDGDRTADIAGLQKDDAVVLEGKYASFLTLRHCRVVSQEPPSAIYDCRTSCAVTGPTAISAPNPVYTDEARKARLSGYCTLDVVVGPDGQTRDIRVTRKLGKGLDENAFEAIRHWRFQPATKDGKPVAVLITVRVKFKEF